MMSYLTVARGTVLTRAAVAALFAGLALSAYALAEPPQREPRREITPQDGARRAGSDFRSYNWVKGLDVFNPAGNHIADVSDLIVNRGSGRIDYVVLSTGATMGMGGKDITIPYGSFRWDSAESRFILDSTEAQLKTYPEFSAENWAGLTDPNADKPGSLREWLNRDQAGYAVDPYAGSLKSAKSRTVEGEITRIDRMQTSTGEQVIANVRTSDGKVHRVSLGPSWYVNGSAIAPMRGDKVSINAYALDRSADDMLVARSMTLSGSELAFRDDQGAANWATSSGNNPSSNDPVNRPHQPTTEPRQPATDPTPTERPAEHRTAGPATDPVTWRSLLASELVGRKVLCRGEECGKVNDVILDRRSGQIAMLSIDPNQNFLGIADTKRLVPWNVATIAVDGTLRIDASKEMVLASPDTPSDLEKLNNGVTPGLVYKAYDVDMPDFKTPRASGHNQGDDERNLAGVNDFWRARGPILAEVQGATSQSVEGEVLDMTKVTFADGTAAARAIKVKTGQGEQLVLLGPATYTDSQKPSCEKGKKVTIEAVKVQIDGKPYLLARRVSSDGATTTLLDSSNTPVWDRR